MGNPNPSVSTRWKKGQSGNPGGKKALPGHLKDVQALTSEELKRTISLHFRKKREELEDIINNPNSVALDLLLASTIKKAIEDGDIYKAEQLFIRCIGKVKETVEVQHPEPLVIERPNGDQVELTTREEEFDAEVVSE